MNLKNKFAKWFSPKAPKSYKTWFGKNLDTKLNDINEAYKASFEKSLFDIDIDNIPKEIANIKNNIANKYNVKNKIFAEYDNKNSKGIPNAIINKYYIAFLNSYRPVEASPGEDEPVTPMKTGILYVVFNESIRDPKTNEKLYKIGAAKKSTRDRYYEPGSEMPGVIDNALEP
jgi:hypothetical protein